MLSKVEYSGCVCGRNHTPESQLREICLPGCLPCSGFGGRDISVQNAVQVALVDNFQAVSIALQDVLALQQLKGSGDRFAACIDHDRQLLVCRGVWNQRCIAAEQQQLGAQALKYVRQAEDGALRRAR